MAQLAGSFSQRCEHGVAVGDGFVAGRLDAAGQSFCGTDGAFHVAILSRASRGPPNSGTSPRSSQSAGSRVQREPVSRLSFRTVLAAKHHTILLNLLISSFLLFSAGETPMFARGTVGQIVAKAGMLLGALCVVTVLFAALPAHRPPTAQ